MLIPTLISFPCTGKLYGILGPPKFASRSFWIEKAKTLQLSHKAMGKVSPILYKRSDMSGNTKSWSHKPSCQHSLSTLDPTQECQPLVQHLWVVIFLKRQLLFALPNPSAKESHNLQTYKTGTRGVSLPRGGTSCDDPAFLLGVASEEPHIAVPDHSLWLLKKREGAAF